MASAFRPSSEQRLPRRLRRGGSHGPQGGSPVLLEAPLMPTSSRCVASALEISSVSVEAGFPASGSRPDRRDPPERWPYDGRPKGSDWPGRRIGVQARPLPSEARMLPARGQIVAPGHPNGSFGKTSAQHVLRLEPGHCRCDSESLSTLEHPLSTPVSPVMRRSGSILRRRRASVRLSRSGRRQVEDGHQVIRVSRLELIEINRHPRRVNLGDRQELTPQGVFEVLILGGRPPTFLECAKSFLLLRGEVKSSTGGIARPRVVGVVGREVAGRVARDRGCC